MSAPVTPVRTVVLVRTGMVATRVSARRPGPDHSANLVRYSGVKNH